MKQFKTLFVAVVLLLAVAILLPGVATAGVISGKISGPVNFADFKIFIKGQPDDEGVEGVVNADGSYRFDLPDNMWLNGVIVAEDHAYGTFFYPTHYPGVFHFDDATWIEYSNNMDIPNLDFAMGEGGRALARIHPEGGGTFAIGSLEVELFHYEADGFFPVGDGLGDFLPPGFDPNPESYVSIILPPGLYTARAWTKDPMDNYVPTFVGNGFSPTTAEPFEIFLRDTNRTVDIEVMMGGSISGTVTAGSDSVMSVLYAFIEAPPVGMYPFAYAITNPMLKGQFTITGLPPASVYLTVMMILDPLFQDYAPMWYDNTFESWNAKAISPVKNQNTPGINFALQKGVIAEGYVTNPDDSPVHPESAELLLFDVTGQEVSGNPIWNQHDDSTGYWRLSKVAAPGMYTGVIRPYDPTLSAMYFNGAHLPWEAEWRGYLPGGKAFINTKLKAGGIISGTVTDPEGDPVENAEVAIYYNGVSLQYDTQTDAEGKYQFTNLPPADEYQLRVSYSYDEYDPDNSPYYPCVFSGNTTEWEQAEKLVVTAGQTTTADIQLVPGARMIVKIGVPPARDIPDSQPFVVGVVREDGVPLRHAATASNDGALFISGEGTHFFLPAGKYNPCAIAINLGADNGDANYRRTFVDGDFHFKAGSSIELTAGNSVTVWINPVEEGHTVSGGLVGETGIPHMGNVAIVDENGFPAGVYAGMMSANKKEYSFSGIPNGTYTVLASVEGYGALVSTWYPNLADPGKSLDDFTPNPNAGTIVVNGADATDKDITVQLVGTRVGVDDRFAPNLVTGFELSGIYPNPFNSSARVIFKLGAPSDVVIKLYDISGREISELVNKLYLAGKHTVNMDGSTLPTGTYFVRMTAGPLSFTKKVVLIK